jgi:hypothetical protein
MNPSKLKKGDLKRKRQSTPSKVKEIINVLGLEVFKIQIFKMVRIIQIVQYVKQN